MVLDSTPSNGIISKNVDIFEIVVLCDIWYVSANIKRLCEMIWEMHLDSVSESLMSWLKTQGTVFHSGVLSVS